MKSMPLEELEREFCHCQPIKREKPKKEKPKKKKVETAKFLDPKRSQQVGIFIQSMKAKAEDLFEALVTLNIKMDIDLMKGTGHLIENLFAGPLNFLAFLFLRYLKLFRGS